ncbi:major facilitator superfamily domain-containing protein [Penicillium cinerascens]|uniref:Major facilitator superfamily domain-containing protein n=1 Tax=Penicillium cinerascens TaxID=70096 RepID=A0A9W9N9P3_9EURO|nr:major facilitator superfamily domain-containing protein [Penicillium cinerascens]KAJ5215812.1 major facilitator superfamily domain-containing protein [Penicillium cinerascens]
MAPNSDSDLMWPPGTVRLEVLQQPGADDAVILQPQPSRDPNDPLNWSPWRKHLNFGLVSLYVFMVFALIDCAPVTWGPMNRQLGFSYEILNDSYAIGCGTLALGGLLLIPFALKYGRRPVYLMSTAIQLGMSVWTARMQTVADLLLINAFSNLVAALAETMVQMTIADVYFVHQRGLMNSIYLLMLTMGVSVAPIAAGYITIYEGWRWVWWWMAVFFGAAFLGFLFFYEETKFSSTPVENNGPSGGSESKDKSGSNTIHFDGVDLEKLNGISGPERQLTAISVDHSIPKKTYKQRLALWSASPSSLSQLAKHMYEPLFMLFYFPAVGYVGLMYGFMTASITVTITTYSDWMTLPPYNFSAAGIGLMGLPAFIGTALAAVICGPLSDYFIIYLSKRNNGIYEPEMRLWVILMFAPFVPAGLLMFGIGLNNGQPWPILAVGLGLVGFGTTPACSISLTYLTDAYTAIIADSMVGVTFVRNVISTIFVFALSPWITSAGITGFYISFSAIVSAILLALLIFVFFGRKFRVKFAERYRFFAKKQIDSRKA